MGKFLSKILRILGDNDPHTDLLEAYEEVHLLGIYLEKSVKELYSIYKAVVEGRRTYTRKKGASTGVSGLRKTIFVEEEFLKKIRVLARKSQNKWEIAMEESRGVVPIDPEEEREIKRVIDFLKQVKITIQDYEKNLNNLSINKKATSLENLFRGITHLAEEFHKIEEEETALIQHLQKNQIDPLIKRMYEQPEQRDGMLLFTVSQKELKIIEKDAKKINQAHDPNYEVKWRHWWRQVQKTEVDEGTDLHDPHINVTLKLFGGPKKKIHLLLAA